MKEALSVEKRIISMKNKSSQEDRKSKKVSFENDSKKKPPKYPFDVQGLQKVLKTMTNEMVDIKKKVAEKSNAKKTFRSFKRNQSSSSQPPNTISNVEFDLEIEDEETEEEETEEEEVVELNGMWDFILPNEEQQEDFPVTTRSKGPTEVSQPSQKKKKSMPSSKDKSINKKSSSKVSQPSPPSTNSSSTSKTLVVSDTTENNIVEYMNKVKANISLHELTKLK